MAQVQLGQMAPATNRRWLVVFNAISRPGFPSQGVGLARFGPSGSPVIAWLTNTTGTNERDPVIARIGSSLASNRLLTGWRTLSGDYRLAVIDTSGTLLEGPVTLDAATRWGNRDDSFRPRSQGSVSWLYGAAGSSTLRLYRYAEATTGINLTPAVRLYSAAPNPFNPRTTIRFDLPVAGQARLSIYDLAGRLVRVLVEGEIPAGSHEAVWDGRDASGRAAPSGSYLARLVAGGKVEGMRLSLVR
jgi:hypothetical protein